MREGFSYWAELDSSKLSEFDNRQWVHALSLGEFNHPIYGTLKFTSDRIKRFAESVKRRITGIDPDVDYDHKMDRAKGNQAAGWIKDAEARSDGLWVLVEWTSSALSEIRDKKYRYFSSDFMDKWTDPEGRNHEDVLLGGALTNRPFLKNLVPVNLSELAAGESQEGKMDTKELAKLLGLGEDATGEQVQAELNKRLEAKKETPEVDFSKAVVSVGEDGTVKVTHPDLEGEVTHKLAPAKEKESDDDSKAELEQLAKDNPAVAAALNDLDSMKQQLSEITVANRLSEVSTKLNDLSGKSGDKKVVLPPAAIDKLKPIMARMPKQLSDQLTDALEQVLKVGLVQLGETTSHDPNNKGGDDGTDNVTKFLSEIDKVREADKELSYADAVKQVRLSDPGLYSRYLEDYEDGKYMVEEA